MPATPIAMVEKTIHVPSGRRSEYFAIIRLPTTKPTEVRPSWRPYSNSVAWRASMANGRSRTFHRPNDRKTGAPETNSDRMIGVPTRVETPSLRFVDDDADARRLLGSILPTRTKTRQAAEKRNVRASRQNAQLMSNAVASRPDRANPIEVEPNELIMIQEFAAASSSSVATSGQDARRWPG